MVKRFVRKLRGASTPEARVVIVTAAGEEGQVDYGSGPMVRDPQKNKYSGLMFPVLEDATLACRWTEGTYGLDSILAYSAVCAGGVDTVPLAS